MRLALYRHWITPLVIGSFFLTSATGVLIFFHLDVGLNKLAHQWLSWALVIGVILHGALHLKIFKSYFSNRTSLFLILTFLIILGTSFFIPKKQSEDPSFGPPIRALSSAPLSVLSIVANKTPHELSARLNQLGYQEFDSNTPLNALIGNDIKTQVRILKLLMSNDEVPRH